DDLGDHRRANVCTHEGDVSDVSAGWHDVHPDHAIHCRVVRQLHGETPRQVPGDPGDQYDPAHGRAQDLLAEFTTLHARLLEQLAVLLLRHALAALLDDGTHVDPSQA